MKRVALAVGWAAILGFALLRAEVEAEREAADARLREARREIVRLERELGDLRQRERGILDELDRLAAEQRLHEATVGEVRLRSEITRVGLLQHEDSLARLERDLETRREYLSFRLREVYKQGPGSIARQLLQEERASWFDAARYAQWLGDRDAQALADLRAGAERVGQERARLDAEVAVLEALHEEAKLAQSALDAARTARERALQGIREDKTSRRAALAELEGAAQSLGGLVQGLSGGTTPALDVGAFRGLLDWPVSGRLTARFGKRVHPKLGTSVPQRGLEIAAPAGTPFRAVFDGRVAFAGPLRGYGLTAIVDHGGETLSVYSHAATLMVGKGQEIVRGEILGHVGDTGSLGGPALYFEFRRDGQPVDPESWLRPR